MSPHSPVFEIFFTFLQGAQCTLLLINKPSRSSFMPHGILFLFFRQFRTRPFSGWLVSACWRITRWINDLMLEVPVSERQAHFIFHPTFLLKSISEFVFISIIGCCLFFVSFSNSNDFACSGAASGGQSLVLLKYQKIKIIVTSIWRWARMFLESIELCCLIN